MRIRIDSTGFPLPVSLRDTLHEESKPGAVHSFQHVARQAPMQILVVNSGSSSIKFSIFAVDPNAPSAEPQSLMDGQLSGIGGTIGTLEVHRSTGSDLQRVKSKVNVANLDQAIAVVIHAISAPDMPPFQAIGYRVVHPGPKLRSHLRITPQVLLDLDAATEFAPLHDPAAVHMIRAFMAKFPDLPHYACFDTIFHQTMPPEAFTYPLPPKYAEQGVHRYGFHGLSCESILRQLRALGHVPLRMAIAHLGSGCSITAVLDGRSIENTMGLTPTGGVIMGTRSGDLDPGLVLYLLRDRDQQNRESITAVETLLNHDSGLTALSGMPNDVKAVRKAANEGNERAFLALNIFAHSITKSLGSCCWLLGGLDAIVFAGGIGEHDPQTRSQILHGLERVGVQIDEFLNRSHAPGIQRISTSSSATAIFIVPAQEDLMIAVHVEEMSQQERAQPQPLSQEVTSLPHP
jgi:acetate kinase